MLFPPAALERAMTIREVILRAMSGAISCMGQADVSAVLSASKALEKMVGRDRIEPPTPGFQV